MSTQPALPGTTHFSNSNKGKLFEHEIEAINNYYRRRGVVDVVKNSEKWECVGKLPQKMTADYYLNNVVKRSDGVCVTGGGWIYRRAPSDVDFSGGNHLCSFIFDAKETSDAHISLEMLKYHQIVRLEDASRCGTVAGFIIKFKKHDRLFFAPVEFVREKYTIWKGSYSGTSGRAAPGTASISIAELEARGHEIKLHKILPHPDWYPVLIKLKREKAED